MKKAISAILALGITAAITVPVFAESEVTVNYEGVKMNFDVEPFIDGDRTLVPMRAIFEKAGADVTWDEDTRTVITAYKNIDDQIFIILQIGNDKAFVGDKAVTLDVPAMIVNDRTFVPLRFVIENLGKDVTWDEETKTVDIK